MHDLAAGGADIALRLCVRPEGGGLIARRVAVDECSVYCSRADAAERGQPRNRRELADHVLIAGGEPAVRRHYREWLATNDPEAAVAMEHDTADGILSAVRAGADVVRTRGEGGKRRFEVDRADARAKRISPTR